MKISEVINRLEELKKEHGDQEVYYSSDIIETHRGFIVDDISFQKHILHPDYEDGDDDICTEGFLIAT